MKTGSQTTSDPEVLQPEVFLVVLNYNGGKDTLECLASLEKLSYPRLTVLLADNGSTDGSAVLVAERFPEVHVSENRENLGYAAGNNPAIRFAMSKGADYVVLLNNDTVIDDDEMITSLIDFERSRRAGPVSPRIDYMGTETVWMVGARLTFLTGRSYHLGKGKRSSDFSSCAPYEVQYVTGCCMLLSRHLLEEVGLLDEDYFFYYEDADYCFRAAAAGRPSYVVPGSVVHHRKSASSGTVGTDRVSRFQAYHMGRGSMIFAGKRLSGARKASFKLAQWTLTLAYVAVMSRSSRAVGEYVRGLRDGLRT